MSNLVDDLEKQVLQLAPAQRAMLLQRLIASLDDADEITNEELWVQEAERRYEEYKKGNIKARAAADVIRDARANLR